MNQLDDINITINNYQEILKKEVVYGKLNIDDLLLISDSLTIIEQRVSITLLTVAKEENIDLIKNYLSDSYNSLNHFYQTEQQHHLDNCRFLLSSALQMALDLPILIPIEKYNFSSTLNLFEKTIKNKNQSLENIVEKISDETKNITSDHEHQKIEIANLQKLIYERESQINNINERFKVDFEILTERLNAKTENILSDYSSQFDNFFAEKEMFANDKTHALEEKFIEGKKLVGLIGDVTVTGNYQKIANEHKKDANLWRWFAIIFMTLFALLLIYTIYDVNTRSFNIMKAIIRIISAIALSYPATYAARESSKHRRLETLNRQAELELTDINPFIEFLPEEKQHKIKEELVAKYFNGNFERHNKFDKNLDEEVSVKAFERLIQAITSIKNK